MDGKVILHGLGTVVHGISGIKNLFGEEELNLLKREVANLQENQALSAKDEENIFSKISGAIQHGKVILHGLGTGVHGISGIKNLFGEEELNLLKREVANL